MRKILVRKTKIILTALLNIVGIFTIIATAEAAVPTITLKVINHTEFTIAFKEIEGIKLNDMPPENKTKDVKKETSSLQGIGPGEAREQTWNDFAPGINSITWKRDTFNEKFEKKTKNDYNQTQAKIVFSKNGFTSPQVFIINQAAVRVVQELKFNYEGKEIKVNVGLASAPNWWKGMVDSEQYYNYTVTFTQK